MAKNDSAQRAERTCPECKASVNRLAAQCPQCDAPLPILGNQRHSSRGRRYVYGKRKAHLFQEIVWLIVVIIVGLLIIFGVQVLAFMRAKKILMVPAQPPRAICRWQGPPSAGPRRAAPSSASGALCPAYHATSLTLRPAPRPCLPIRTRSGRQVNT